MPKTSDYNRILRLLSETEGLSNLRIRTDLNLTDQRYATVKDQLLTDGLIEKLQMRGGGVRLTSQGEKVSPSYEGGLSDVSKEADLYQPLADFLTRQATEDGVEAVVLKTHSLRARGRWQNPDVTRIAIENYLHLRRIRVTVTTYEVKQFASWNVSVVYEAASHHRFSHESYVVLEWPDGISFSATDPTYRIDQISRECQRFGVGLATLEPHYKSYRLRPRLDPAPSTPDDEDVEAWLDYMFSRDKEALTSYNERVKLVQETFHP